MTIFINYRGIDADFAPALLFARLSRRFGARRVFLDAESIAPGEDYVQRLLEGVRSSKVLLAVIGPQWFAADSSGRRLIDNPHDWIRRELVTAFECGVTVIPVFTDGATPPRPEDLPSDIAQLGRQHGLPLRRVRAGEDVEAIVREVSAHVPVRRRWVLLAAAVVLVIGAGVALPSVLRQDSPDSTTSREVQPTKASSTPPAPKAEVWYEGRLTLDGEAFRTGYTLDTSPPAKQPAGDIGLVCQLGCAANEIAGTEFVAWKGDGLPDREQCVDLLNRNRGQRSLSVKEGTKACVGTAQGRVGHLQVAEISGPGRMRIDVKVWDKP